MTLGSQNFGLPGSRAKRIIKKAVFKFGSEVVKIEVRNKTQNTVRIGWNFTAESEDIKIKGFTNLLTIEEAIS